MNTEGDKRETVADTSRNLRGFYHSCICRSAGSRSLTSILVGFRELEKFMNRRTSQLSRGPVLVLTPQKKGVVGVGVGMGMAGHGAAKNESPRCLRLSP